MKGNYPIPFDRGGSQLHYVDHWDVTRGGVSMVDNFEFNDTLEIEGINRGRSAADFTMLRSDGTRVTVFMVDMIAMFKRAKGGKVKGRFTFCKRGQNYGCKLVEE